MYRKKSYSINAAGCGLFPTCCRLLCPCINMEMLHLHRGHPSQRPLILIILSEAAERAVPRWRTQHVHRPPPPHYRWGFSAKVSVTQTPWLTVGVPPLLSKTFLQISHPGINESFCVQNGDCASATLLFPSMKPFISSPCGIRIKYFSFMTLF